MSTSTAAIKKHAAEVRALGVADLTDERAGVTDHFSKREASTMPREPSLGYRLAGIVYLPVYLASNEDPDADSFATPGGAQIAGRMLRQMGAQSINLMLWPRARVRA